jgi:hypothetical protein
MYNEKEKKMYREDFLRMLAGTVVLTGLTLGYFVNAGWFLLTAFAGLNLLQSSFTHWCPAMYFLDKCGVKRCRCGIKKES